ncbi:MAG: chemotaxis protein CheB [Chloroflexi bacterium]|nr:chemotaxis protein CheB [Chloroflexota bacterium]
MTETPAEDLPVQFAGFYDIVALAASAGGLLALSKLLSSLPKDFPAAILVLQHLDPQHRSLMAEILGRRTSLKVLQASGGEVLRPATVYVAPPGHHLLVDSRGVLRLSDAALVHFLRPSADILFTSIGENYKNRAIVVVLTGTGSDGADGVRNVKHKGGIVIAQEMESADFSGMPYAAIATGCVDYTLPLQNISAALVNLVTLGKIA